jgi:hypothetical protein
VLVHTSVQVNPTAPGPVELIALWNALVKKLAP